MTRLVDLIVFLNKTNLVLPNQRLEIKLILNKHHLGSEGNASITFPSRTTLPKGMTCSKPE